MENRRPYLRIAFLLAAGILSSGCHDSSSPPPPAGTVPLATSHALIAWNDLGMHCMDNDYSVFGILPPYNNLHAQLVDRATGSLVTSGVTITYEATADTRGSVNTTSVGKTNFWSYVLSLFGVSLAPNTGLAGNPAPGAAPAPLVYDPAAGYWKAEGIPIIPTDDAGQTNYYPMVKVTAKNAGGTILASSKTVLPVSNEMTCKGCHSSYGMGIDAMPVGGWVLDASFEKDWKLNILRIHDEKNFGNPLYAAVYAAALSAVSYDATGLENTVRNSGKAVLCAKCHASNALGTAGAAGTKPLTEAIHFWHAHVIQDSTGLPLDDNTADRTACYVCHPGSVTQCLRGVMGNAKDASGNPAIQCQSCHGNMSAVGSPSRRGWIDLPDCGQCHFLSGSPGAYVRDNTVFSSPGVSRPTAGLFASPGLYKLSAGHFGIQCEACHGPTHAEYACSEANDNVQSLLLQGYAGKITECAVCHLGVPMTKNAGPHGLHTIGQAWVNGHGRYAQADVAYCATCHGTDSRGTKLSVVSADRSFDMGSRGTKTLPRSGKTGCYDCHNGPGGW